MESNNLFGYPVVIKEEMAPDPKIKLGTFANWSESHTIILTEEEAKLVKEWLDSKERGNDCDSKET